MSARGFLKQFSTAFGLRSKGGVAYDYDDVTIAPSFTPLARDYAEIFNCSQPSSIPILELDQGDDECWSSNLDYGNVFGDGHIEWTQVFSLADGARKTDDSLSHSERSDLSIALEESQNQYLFARKHNISCDNITQDEKGCETMGETENMAESFLNNVTDEIVSLKSAEVNTSGVAMKDLKRLSNEALIRNHSGSISSGGLSRYETDEYIEIDVRSGTEFGLDMPISSGMSIDANLVISEEPAFEVNSPSDFVLDFGSPNSTFKGQESLRINAGEVPCVVSTSSSREVVKMASLDKPFIKDSATDDNTSRQIPLTQDQGGACAVPEILMENLNTCSSTNKAGKKAEDGSYNSLEGVKFQEVNGLRLPLVNNHQINASVVISQESSESAPQVHSQRDIDKLNAVSEADILLKITVSRNAFGECNHRDHHQNKVLDELTSIDFPGDATVIKLESQSSKTMSPSAIQCNLGNVGPVLKNSTTLQSGGFANRTVTSAIDDHLLSSSDDEIDKNSEAGIYVSDVKRAIREAQVWIKIAKESTGVKGFMNPFVTKSFGQVKIVKEVHDSRVKESPQFFELGQTTIANDCRMSAARKEHIDPWSTSSEIKTTPTNNDGDEITINGTVYCESDKQHEKADVVVDISSEEKIELASAIQYVTPWFSISEEKLTMYDTKESFKPVTKKRDATVTVLDPHDQVFDSEDFLGYASAEENLVSSDTNDEIIGKNSNLLNQYQISEMENTIMQNLAASEVVSIREDVSAACFSHLNEGPAVEESCEIEALPLQNGMTHETKVAPDEMTVVGKTDEKEGKQLQNTATHNIASEALTEIFSKKSENDSVSMDTHVIVDVPMLISVVPEETDDTSEDGMPPCLNCVDEYPKVEDNDEVEAMVGKNMVIPTENNISMNDNDLSLSYDHSNVEMMVDADTTRELTVTLLNQEFRIGVSEGQTPCILEYIELEIEELESAPTVEFTSIENYAHPHYGGSEVEPIRGDTVSGKSLAPTKENSRSTSRIHYYEKQERDGACFLDLDSGTQASEELHDVVIKEAEIIEKGHETKNVERFINYQPSADASAKEDAFSLDPEHDTHEVEAGINFCIPLSDIITNDKTIEFEQEGDKWISESGEGVNFCKPLTDILMNDKTAEFESQGDNMNSEPVDSVLEPGKQFCESLPDTIESKSTCDFEKQGGSFVQPPERHERKKWEIPKESFELPELKVGIFEIQCTAEKDTFEVKSQMDKHERKKWEIPMETYEFPVLGDDDILEEKDEIEGQDMEQGAKSAEKPERKKWKIQKEAHEASNLCGEAVGQTSGQDRFIFITASEDEMMMNLHYNLMQSEDTSQDYVFHNEIYAKEELIVSAKRDSSGFSVDDSEEYLTKKHLQEINILYEEEGENQLYETSDQLEAKVGEGESDTQGECAKVCEDVNVKDEIKRTLGMLWKRIYKSKHDEDFETTESGAQEEVFGMVVDKDLNLNGPVELVESPKKQNDIAFLNFCGQSSRSNNNAEEASYLKQFEVNGSKSSSRKEFISATVVTEDVQGNTSSASDSCELQEDGINIWGDKTCKQNFKNSASDPVFDSEDIQPLNRFEDLLSDYSLVNDDENAQKLKLVPRDNGSKEGETVETTSMGKELQENDGENYLEKEVEELLADGISDRSFTNSEKQDITSGREESVSALESRIADGMQSHEPKLTDKKESGPDRSNWKGLEEEESRDKCTKQDKTGEVNVLPKEKADARKVAVEINMSQLTVKEKLNDDDPSKVEERAKEGLHKEVIPNLEVLQNILRAKEMERIAVERAIRDARERAFAEVRERAAMERAKAEAQQKSAVRNQGKHERALLQTKLAAEENSLESKRKAEFESAAVERATAEARQRALERALSQKDQTSESRRSGSASASNFQCGSTSEDRLSDGNSCESALRFKATYERHQQIAERAAKVIDEKNTRDLLVQREQAERNRLAEVLDAEVKRWENGKTSNVRALLCTIQYVLGPDSGWKPIHLTDIVTPEALKKAYRKATLFLHPDKLQQRGATIKQKYICEKVFDLLKEAWKRVDRDEL